MRVRPIPNDDHDDSDEAFLGDQGLSLEELGQTFSQMMGHKEIPYADANPNPSEVDETAEVIEHDPISDEATESDDCPITPKSILEAFLFVGHPQRESLSAEHIAGLMRGVRVDEVDQWIVELNEEYRANQHAMEIVSEKGGYRMRLASDLTRVRDRMYGKIKETRLNQTAIDVLSLVAYQPGITREELEKQYNQSIGSVLSMLIRRNLLELKKEPERNAPSRYFPTERMLNLFGLASLDELPQVEETESI